MDCYRIRLIKLKKKRGPLPGTTRDDQVVVTINDDGEEEVSVAGPRKEDAVLTGDQSDDGEVTEDKGAEAEEVNGDKDPVAEEGAGQSGDESDDSEVIPNRCTDTDGAEVIDDEQPGTSRSFLEQIARERTRNPAPAPPQTSRSGNNVAFKNEIRDSKFKLENVRFICTNVIFFLLAID